MQQKLPVIIVLVLVTLGISAGIFYVTQNKGSLKLPSSNTTVTDQNNTTGNENTINTQGTQPANVKVAAGFTLSADKASYRIGEDITYTLSLTAKDFVTYALEGHFTYDPQVISVSQVNPTAFFANPTILENTIDSKKGTVDYAIGGFEPTPAEGAVFTIKAKALKATSKSPLLFDRQTTKTSLVVPNTETIYTDTQINFAFDEKPVTIK